MLACWFVGFLGFGFWGWGFERGVGERKQADHAVQKHSAGLTAMTERTLGAKAGHLELLKGGKKNKDTKEGKGKEAEVKKGGSKKFG